MNLPKYYKLNFDKAKYNQWISLISGSVKEKDKEKNIKELKAKIETETDESLQLFVLYFAWNEGQDYPFQSANNSRKLLIVIFILIIGTYGQPRQ